MAFNGQEAMRAFIQAKLDEHVRPEVQAIVKRGNITLAEWQEMRGNSWEFEHMYTSLDDEAFAYAVEHNLKNCAQRERPCVTYDEACTNILAPELLKRFLATTKDRDVYQYQTGQRHGYAQGWDAGIAAERAALTQQIEAMTARLRAPLAAAHPPQESDYARGRREAIETAVAHLEMAADRKGDPVLASAAEWIAENEASRG